MKAYGFLSYSMHRYPQGFDEDSITSGYQVGMHACQILSEVAPSIKTLYITSKQEGHFLLSLMPLLSSVTRVEPLEGALVDVIYKSLTDDSSALIIYQDKDHGTAFVVTNEDCSPLAVLSYVKHLSFQHKESDFLMASTQEGSREKYFRGPYSKRMLETLFDVVAQDTGLRAADFSVFLCSPQVESALKKMNSDSDRKGKQVLVGTPATLAQCFDRGAGGDYLLVVDIADYYHAIVAVIQILSPIERFRKGPLL